MECAHRHALGFWLLRSGTGGKERWRRAPIEDMEEAARDRAGGDRAGGARAGRGAGRVGEAERARARSLPALPPALPGLRLGRGPPALARARSRHELRLPGGGGPQVPMTAGLAWRPLG